MGVCLLLSWAVLRAPCFTSISTLSCWSAMAAYIRGVLPFSSCKSTSAREREREGRKEGGREGGRQGGREEGGREGEEEEEEEEEEEGEGGREDGRAVGRGWFQFVPAFGCNLSS